MRYFKQIECIKWETVGKSFQHSIAKFHTRIFIVTFFLFPAFQFILYLLCYVFFRSFVCSFILYFFRIYSSHFNHSKKFHFESKPRDEYAILNKFARKDSERARDSNECKIIIIIKKQQSWKMYGLKNIKCINKEKQRTTRIIKRALCNFTTGKQHFVHIPFAELLFVCVSFSAGFIRSPFILSKNGWNYTESNVRCIEAPWSQFNFITFILFHFVDFFFS